MRTFTFTVPDKKKEPVRTFTCKLAISDWERLSAFSELTGQSMSDIFRAMIAQLPNP